LANIPSYLVERTVVYGTTPIGRLNGAVPASTPSVSCRPWLVVSVVMLLLVPAWAAAQPAEGAPEGR
jgi:hypothetical protein